MFENEILDAKRVAEEFLEQAKLKEGNLVVIGRGTHRLNASVSDRVGAIINKDIEVVKGRIGSFINNFMASANGCKMPYGPTMLGPFRSCMYPKILRSTNVRKAMAIRMGTRSVRILIKNTIRERI